MAEEIIVGSVAVGVVPSAKGFAERARREIVPSASNIGHEWGQRASEGINNKLGDFMTRWSREQGTQAKVAGENTGASYGESFRAAIDKVLRDLPDAKIKANTKEAQDAVAKLRAELEDLKSKEIGVDMTNAEALARISEVKDQLAGLTEHPHEAVIGANIDDALARVEEMRAIAEKPIMVPVKLTGEGKAGAGASLEADMAAAGETAGQGFGARFSSRVRETIGPNSEKMASTREGMVEKLKTSGEEAGKEFGGAFSGVLGAVSKVGIPAAIAGALVAVSAVLGERLDMAQKQLEVSMATNGASWDQYKGQVNATGAAMTKYGETQDQVDQSIRQVLQVTGSVKDAIKAQGYIADIAASQHMSLASATTQYDRALTGNARTLKQMGVIQASGSDITKAMTTAQKLLTSQVEQSGSMANFAAIHHMTLAQAEQAVAGATGVATAAQNALAAKGLTLTSATTLLTAAQGGNSKALKTLAKDHISLAQLQGLVSQSTQGNIADFNKLGIEVLPKSANAAMNFDQVNRIMAARMGGQASAVADSFSGKIANIRAKFMNAAEAVGMHVLPYLEKFMDWIIAGLPKLENLAARIAGLVKPALIIFLKGLGDLMHILTIGPVKDIALAIAGVTGAVFAMNAILAINPFVALAIAIVFIVGLIDKFHNQIIHGIDDAINWVKHIWDVGWSWVLNFLKRWWPLVLLVVFGGMGALIDLVVKYHKQIVDTVQAAWNTISSIYKSSIGWVTRTWGSFWSDVKTVAHDAWTWMTGGFGTFFGGLKTAFGDAVTAVGRIWHGVQDVAKKPVNFIVGTVYNKGIVPVVDAIAGVFGFHPLNAISGFARGTSGAPPGWAWVGEQGPELVRMTGGETVLTHQQSMATGLWGHGLGFAQGTGGPGTGGTVHGIPLSNTPTGDESLPLVGPILHGLRNLAGDALAAGIGHVLNPLLNAIPGMNSPWGRYVKRDVTSMESKLVDWVKGVSVGPGGSSSGGAILADAARYQGHRYVFGGPSNPQGGWDCSSFASYVLGHDMNMSIPGGSWARVTANGASHGPVASQYKFWSGAHNKGTQDPNHIQPGDLLTWDTHVGFGAGRNRMFSAYDTASGTIYTPATAGPHGEQLVIRVLDAIGAGVASVAQGALAGSDFSNGVELYHYLLRNLFGGNKIASAGAIASIWGESGWNPFAVGTGGRGLIGWTPPSTISDAAFNGGMATQMPAILAFVVNSGDSGVIAQMLQAGTVSDAAWLWGRGVERFGIPDVHPTGISLATQIMNRYAGGTPGAAPGWAMVGENGMELVNFHGGETVLSHEQSMAALGGSLPNGYWAGTIGSAPGDMHSGQHPASLKEAVRGVEQKLDKLIKATQGVGNDVAGSLNATGRIAGTRANYNNVR